MDFYNYLLGAQTIGFLMAGIIFTILAAIIMKVHYYKKHKVKKQSQNIPITFKLKHWIKNNYMDFLLSIIIAFIGIRFLDVLLHWVSPKMEVALGWSIPVTEDQIFYYFFIGGIVQWWLHNKYKK